MERDTQRATNATNATTNATEAPNSPETNHHLTPIQEAKTAAAQTEMTSASYFKDLRQFVYNSRHDKRLTPATQLMYRVLVDLANANCWLYPFAASNAELKEITHITSDRMITQVKQRLKSLKYINFEGNPSQYVIYSPPAHKVAGKVAKSDTPQTPRNNTSRRKYSLKKKLGKEESEAKRSDVQHSEYDWENDPELDQFV